MNLAESPVPGLLTGINDLEGSLANRVYQSLLQAILFLKLPPGTILRKSAICAELGVSRQPVSEAIARLAAEGLVDVVPQSGTRISRFSLDEMREAAFMREALELAAVGKVAAECTPEQLAQLTRNVRMQELLVEDDDEIGFYEIDEEFHSLLMSFTGFSGLAANVLTVSLKLKRARLLILPETGRSTQVIREHTAILDAIRNHDPAAAQDAMRLHLSQLTNRFASLEATYPDYFRIR